MLKDSDVELIKDQLAHRTSLPVTELIDMLIDFKIAVALEELSKRLEVITKP